jgi:catechol 2,3-dioxygenase-like lactoylglutathione lyase family enzyme
MTAGQIRFDSVNLIVTDMEASRAFYATLGLAFNNAHEPVWDRHHVTSQNPSGDGGGADFDLDSASFAQQWNAGWPGGSGSVLGFKVEGRERVDELVATLAAAGAPVQQEPYDAFWGARYAIVTDPDGNSVGIMSEADGAHRWTPPDPE